MLRAVRRLASGIRTRARRRHIGAACVALALSCGTTPFKGDSGIKPLKFELWDVHCPSGLRVLFERAPGATTSAVVAVVGAGAVEDPPGREGLAHLVEHLTFRAHGPGEGALWPRLWALGASFNAATDFEDTTYHEVAPAARLPQVLATEGRRLLDPLEGVDEATFAVERDVVRNELRERNETHAFGAAYAGAFRAAYPAGHPYHRDLAGTHDSLSALTLEDARQYVRAHYRPDNTTMVVVGDVELAKVEGFVKATLPAALYGDPAHPKPIAQPPTPPPAPEPPADRTLHRERAPVTTPELWIAWSLPGGAVPEHDLASMWGAITWQNFARGRFDDDDIADVSFNVWQGVQATTMICRVRLTTGAHPEAALKEVVSQLPWIGGDEIYLDKRIERLKLAHLSALAFDAENIQTRSLTRADYAHVTGRASAYGPMIQTIQGITSDQSRAFAERYLSADRARAVFLEPLGDDARPPSPIAAAQDLKELPPLPPETLRDLAQVRRLDGMRTAKLDNGLEVVVVPRPGTSVVTAELGFHVDRATTGTGLASAADVAREVRLEESPSDFGIQYAFDVDRDLVSFTVRAGATNLPRALGMLSFGARSLDVDWPSDKFREVKAPLWRRYEASPEGRAQRAVWRAMFREHPFGAWPSVDDVASRKAGEIQAWIDQVIRPANGVVVIVGDVTADEAIAAARDALAALSGAAGPIAAPAPVPLPAKMADAHLFEGGPGVIVTHRPGSSQAEVELRCLLPPVDARRAAVYDVVANLVDGSLETELRHRLGSTYGVHVAPETLRGGSAFLRVAANIDNGRLADSLRVLRDFWASAEKGGISPERVSRARDREFVSHMIRHQTSPALADALVWRWNRGWDLRTLDDEPNQFASVEPAEVDATLAACAGNLVLGVTGDERMIRAAFAAAKTPAPASVAP